jgi:hypothetical protein
VVDGVVGAGHHEYASPHVGDRAHLNIAGTHSGRDVETWKIK